MANFSLMDAGLQHYPARFCWIFGATREPRVMAVEALLAEEHEIAPMRCSLSSLVSPPSPLHNCRNREAL
jgi:hypothetical protein